MAFFILISQNKAYYRFRKAVVEWIDSFCHFWHTLSMKNKAFWGVILFILAVLIFLFWADFSIEPEVVVPTNDRGLSFLDI